MESGGDVKNRHTSISVSNERNVSIEDGGDEGADGKGASWPQALFFPQSFGARSISYEQYPLCTSQYIKFDICKVTKKFLFQNQQSCILWGRDFLLPSSHAPG